MTKKAQAKMRPPHTKYEMKSGQFLGFGASATTVYPKADQPLALRFVRRILCGDRLRPLTRRIGWRCTAWRRCREERHRGGSQRHSEVPETPTGEYQDRTHGPVMKYTSVPAFDGP